MYPNQIVNQVSKKKRTVSTAYYKQKKAVLFACLLLGVLPFATSCVTGEISRGITGEKSTLYFPENSKYTVVYETSYGTLEMNLDAAVACMLAVIVPPDYEAEAIKAQAILLRTELFSCYENQESAEAYQIFFEKVPYEKKYFTFLEQKQIYGENYSANLAVYRHAVMETAGMYVKTTGENNNAGEIADVGWFAVSAGSTREGIPCEKDYQSENYYSESAFTRKEYQDALKRLYEESCVGAKIRKEDVKQIEKICFQRIDGVDSDDVSGEIGNSYGKDFIFQVLFTDGSGEEFQVSAEALCEVFHLNSPYVEEIVEGTAGATITVKGVGHGSGMSLFAANELAKEGKNYAEILNYFFTNIAIDKFE